MKKAILGLLSILLLFSVMAAYPAMAPVPADDGDLVIQVSPSTILLDWKAKGDVRVTVHAEVMFSLFDPSNIQVDLGGIQALYIYSDARGDLVAKFDFDAVKGLVEDGAETATFSLTAIDKAGTVYTGSDEVRIKGD